MLRTLSEQTSAEKSSSKTAADIRALRQQAESEEMLIAEVQNELARLAVDALNTQGHNDRLKQALQLLDAELKDKVCHGSGVSLLTSNPPEHMQHSHSSTGHTAGCVCCQVDSGGADSPFCL